MANTFALEILTPERSFFTGQVDELIVNTPSGEMGILYHTLPLVTILAGGIIRILQSNKWMEAVADEGFVRVGRSKVTVLVSTCEWPHEIDEDRVDRGIDALHAQLKKSQSMREYKIAKAQLAAALAKLKIKSHDI